MTPERWTRIEELFHAARALPHDARLAFIADACPDDRAMQHEISVLLQDAASDAGLLGASGIMGAAQVAAGTTATAMVGRSLGGYSLQALLGAGGMGEVYRARDATLQREVAIKILPRAFTSDPAWLARFEREARMLAALNHPNICAIHGFEEADGIRFLILELVEGETLATKVPLPLGEALTIARQIAGALEAAHDKRIVHRDLKPANITITADGVVKVLDFGLAKSVGGDGSSPELTNAPGAIRGGGAEGAVIGTAAYMSPEQARGLPVDKRTDIWAFGCVAYEMLTGRKAFHGDTVTDCLAAILSQDPDWTALTPSSPPTVVTLIKRCLEKDAQRRLADIGEARRELEEVLATVTARVVPGPVQRSTKRHVSLLTYAASIAGLFVVGMFAVRAVRELMLKPQRVDIGLAHDEFIPSTHSSELALSSDGTLIAYASSKRMTSMPRMNPGSDSAVDSDQPDDLI